MFLAVVKYCLILREQKNTNNKIPSLTVRPEQRGDLSVFLFDAEQPAQDPAQGLGALDHNYLHMLSPCLSVFCSILCGQQTKRSGRSSRHQSGMVSTATSAPLRVLMVMQSEPSAYSLLTPSGYAAVSSALSNS